MKLKKILKDIKYKTIKGSKEIEISGICSDSRYVAPGNLFIAKKGGKYDGTDFIPKAVSAGAVAVVTDIFDPFLKNIVQIIHDDVAEIEADIASAYYNFPSKSLFVVGITGTCGKTTIAYLIKHILDGAKISTGLIGTIECILGSTSFHSSLTTPDNLLIQKYLKEMVVSGCKSAVLEVSSHGLDQGRLKNIKFNVAIFTNLSQDHLDYHHSMENYSDAKKRLFDSLSSSGKAIVNIDDIWSAKMIENTKAEIITYGIKNERTDLFAKNITFSFSGLQFDLFYRGEKHKVSSSLIGRYNVYNILAAIAASLEEKLSLSEIIKSVSTFKSATGRLEKIDSNKDFQVFIDFAHKPEALKNVLFTLKELHPKRIITIFGCGGDRDREKRPLMGKISSELSDISIITSDNPRSEDPISIISQIVKDMKKDSFLIEPDRYKAIEKAINLAKKGDVVLIAGKGHESSQIFANKTILFNDKEVAKQILG